MTIESIRAFNRKAAAYFCNQLPTEFAYLETFDFAFKGGAGQSHKEAAQAYLDGVVVGIALENNLTVYFEPVTPPEDNHTWLELDRWLAQELIFINQGTVRFAFESEFIKYLTYSNRHNNI